MECCSEEKKKLIEEVGLHFEKAKQMSPLAARIYAIMILSPYDGHTFDEILEMTCASKSSVSTQLNLLLQLKKVEYFTKSGDRKRYFRASKSYLINTLKEDLERVKEEIALINKITEFNSLYNQHKYEEHGVISVLFRAYLIKQQGNMKDTIEKMSKFKNQ
ncbi:MAG: transcriptional regulator [Zunongwangia sp.]|uniref:Transcriptional regulator n=2 Tax=Zunongwangia profunda TaxID=398743 RepID=D5BDR3_ZUNPS|nr:transcriptional regulator [Zunongwangia profunda]MAC65551.1 transcriptional regulator [Flavobacteriaceae bacterium]MAO37836.1 transcriptional regulator [Zunongwangia sp.]ADF50654.1 transcriptional regulator [Zunongwangia profunda SM-A87]HAJ82982.1 transcriptional regulator [Zunongwangia profunda]HCV80131.1 transcriptional regulator [Zunongwangia profunda]|tara:strand:+ start:4449 stop:4931 length:483 start_codon:yes stop_codon:yes gene_type:complete